MSEFRKPPRPAKHRYSMSGKTRVWRMGVLQGKTADIILWGGDGTGRPLDVSLDFAGLGTITEGKATGKHERLFSIKATGMGKSQLSARNARGEVWAKLEFNVLTDGDLKTARMVSASLTSTSVSKVRFQFAGHSITPQLFGTVRQLVNGGAIAVRSNPGLSSGGRYVFGDNLFEFRFSNASGVKEKALIVHEAVHAIQDYQAKAMKTILAEAEAYLAQMIYARANLSSKPNFGSRGRVFEVAWDIAGNVLDGKQPTDAEQARLRSAVRADPTYANHKRGAKYRFDGV